MWIDTRNYEPIADGVYLVQMANGDLNGLEYTLEGGWNTHLCPNGTVYMDSKMTHKQVARWFDAPTPPDVPDEWFDEWLHK